ncbi:hypothetical protein NDU88_004559 [Pleurodeles waltl]|uniref:Uncharacterized protein n=1 Tax=Pleurodeles waltl TaxID=8319 RepID=A0AAV7T8H4_PLEWA|nr:hypothetical protein NDU88_004559 [Pleurodeles waltl]
MAPGGVVCGVPKDEEVEEVEELPPDLQKAVIITIPKQGKLKDRCESYRPIFLLNTEKKMLSNVLEESFVKASVGRRKNRENKMASATYAAPTEGRRMKMNSPSKSNNRSLKPSP